ncbi:MAG: hypothetical protein NTX87_02405 [Planctomycetota bacterium]|nr:hypothetical protein [Planctomycetota bacterium]
MAETTTLPHPSEVRARLGRANLRTHDLAEASRLSLSRTSQFLNERIHPGELMRVKLSRGLERLGLAEGQP